MDFAIGAETKRRNLERWAKGLPLPPASGEHAHAVLSALPAYTTANSEALGAMRVEQARKFRLDEVVEAILTEIAQRLPRTIDAYRYHQDYAHETIAVPGIGEIKVSLHESDDGIFRTISTVESEFLRVWNCRESGVKYLDRLTDISRPSNVEVKPLATEVNLYAKGDIDGKVEEELISWLTQNVLLPLQAASRPAHQATELPPEEPYPEGKVGPLYAFVDEESLKKIVLIRDNPKKAYPDERKAARTGPRLLPFNEERGDAPEIVHDCFVWCGVGRISANTDLDKLSRIGREHRRDSFSGSQGIAVLTPKTATGIYVVDWHEWETGDYQAVAKTIVPIAQYQGNFRQPIVLIGRDIELDEVEAVYLPQKTRRGSR